MSLPPPLVPGGPFVVVHHRKLNSRHGLEEVLPALQALPSYVHVAEGDLCWAVDGDRTVLYMHHPERLYDTLPPDELVRLAAEGELWTLEAALDARYDDVVFLVELKTGQGPRAVAIREAVRLLQERRPGRFWFDTFGAADNDTIKAADDSVATSLHVKALSDRGALETSVSPLRLAWRALSSLATTDVLTLSYKTSGQRWLGWAGASLGRTVRGVEAAGKVLVCGGVTTPAAFDAVREAGARGAYIKFDWRALKTPS